MLVIPQFHFGVDLGEEEIVLPAEHTAAERLKYERAHARHTYESNRIALWEVNHRLTRTGRR